MWQAERFLPYPPIVARCETTFSFTRITTNGSTEPTPSRRVPSGALPGTWQHLHPRTGWLPSSFCFHPAAFDQLPKPADTRYGPASVAGGGKERRKLAGIARPPRPVVEKMCSLALAKKQGSRPGSRSSQRQPIKAFKPLEIAIDVHKAQVIGDGLGPREVHRCRGWAKSRL